ncbi:hypothetical protein [uncultured Mucilaginibacter sp.]|uniref:hypothetical protein n=1 Tax=uncultured Mucilaginibacter sp. TaxID=797541 RepID=UPI0025DF38A6|nr:hypothetical protein [uncultured Mucilaginibacter sp.]
MRQIIITFEFQPQNAYRALTFTNMIRKYTQFAFLNSTSCIIWTSQTVVMVRDNLLTGIGTGDKIFVSEIAAPAAWSFSINKEVAEYLIKNLK